jgi:PAS domain S-box-containing protein
MMKEKKRISDDTASLIKSLKSENEVLKKEVSSMKFLAATEALGNSTEHRDNKESRGRFKTVFESSNLGNKIISSDLKILQVNPALVTLLGYDSKEDIIGTRILDYSPRDHQHHWQTLQEHLWTHASSSFSLETTLIKKDGSVIWCQVNSILFQDKGETLGYTTIQDITTHYRLRKFEALIKSGNDIICIVGADGTYEYVSPSVKKALHIEPEFFIGKKPFEFVHPDDLPRVISAFEYILTTDEPVHVSPFRFKNENGDWCWLDSFVTNKIDDPAILGIVINARDISIKVKDEQEKLVEAEKLRISNERYRLAGKATKDIIWDWDLENNQLRRDESFEKILGRGLDNETEFSASWKQYIHPDDKELVLKSIVTATANPKEKFWQQEYRYIRVDGTVAFISDQGYIVRDAAKKAIRMVGAMHDNTELKEKKLRILEQNERMHEIAQINSHVIRKPVASILGLINLLDKESIVGEDNLEILEYLVTSARELDAVIRQINEKVTD